MSQPCNSRVPLGGKATRLQSLATSHGLTLNLGTSSVRLTSITRVRKRLPRADCRDIPPTGSPALQTPIWHFANTLAKCQIGVCNAGEPVGGISRQSALGRRLRTLVIEVKRTLEVPKFKVSPCDVAKDCSRVALPPKG